MPTATWERLDPERRDRILQASMDEFAAHGFADGSMNVIARNAGVAKGSLFQYFTDKTDLVSYMVGVVCDSTRETIEGRMAKMDFDQPVFDFLGDLFETWVDYYSEHEQQRQLVATSHLESGPAGVAVRRIGNAHYLEVLGPLLEAFRDRGDLRADADLDALTSLLILLCTHLAVAPFVPNVDPLLGLADGGPEQPALGIRRLLAPLEAAYAAPVSERTRARKLDRSVDPAHSWRRVGEEGPAQSRDAAAIESNP